MKFIYLFFIGFALMLTSCNQSDSTSKSIKKDSTADFVSSVDSTTTTIDSVSKKPLKSEVNTNPVKSKESKVYVYNFHVTNRCPSCIAIEEATTKTLKLYFKDEFRTGKLIRQIIDVDAEENQKLAEKYEVFGSCLLVVKVENGKETKADLTGDGFKFAKNKEDRFIEILKNKITEFLK